MTPHASSWIRAPRYLLLVAVALLSLTVASTGADQKEGDEPPAEPDKPSVEPGSFEVRFTDNSALKLLLKDEKIEVVTSYGKLLIPIKDVHYIEFATRVTDETTKKIEAAIKQLGHADFKERNAATATLLRLADRAYPAILEATKSKDAEVVKRAEELLEQIRDVVPEDRLAIRKHDVVHTADSKISGRIEMAALKAETSQFGEVKMKLADVRSLKSPLYNAEPVDDTVVALPDPGHMVNYQREVGKTLVFQVTGAAGGGTVWGSDFYTLDSTLAVAAVHAGVLKNGKTGKVRVKILGPQVGFAGTTKNGVTTHPFPNYPGAYKFVKPGARE